MRRKKAAKNKKAKEEAERTNLYFWVFAVLFFLAMITPRLVRSADFGAGLSQSSTGTVGKNYNLGFGVTQKLSVSLYASDSTQESDDSTVDNSAKSYKGTLIYKPDSSLRLAIGYKKIDDYNDYKGVSYSGKITVKNNPSASKETSLGTSKFSIGVNRDEMKYSQDKDESYEKLSLSLGFSQVIGDFFTFGVDWSKNAYLPKGTNTISAFKNKTITDTNISDTVEGLSDSSAGAFIEYNDLSFWSMGVSYSHGKNYLDKSDTSNSIELYADIDFWENITISPSYSMTRSKSTTDPKTNSTSINISISY